MIRPLTLAAGLALLVLAAFLDLSLALRGLLFAWAFCLGPALGALALLLTHGLTGGRWGDALRPTFAAFTATLPWLALVAVVPAFFLGSLYGWPHGLEERPGVGTYWLNEPLFLARAALSLGFLAALALFLPAGRRAGVGVSAVGLVLYVVAVTVVALDWLMPLDPKWVSTTYPALVAVQTILEALALAALFRAATEPAVAEDLGGLLLAALLAVVYLAFMQYLVMWYSNLPEKVAWYAAREAGFWPVLPVLAFLAGGLVPFLVLLPRASRRDPGTLAVMGGLVLLGVLLHLAWMVLPAGPGGWVLLPAAGGGLLVLGGLALALPTGHRQREAKRGAHGAHDA
ncbi:MAG: hypothetical protein KDG89_11000 [Geminicoccaceae bacterium]|nr:hypothetical protein [Geminicoccaceae bacterium]